VLRYVSDTHETFTQTLPQQVVAMILKPTAMVLGESAQRMETVQYTTQDLALCAPHSRNGCAGCAYGDADGYSATAHAAQRRVRSEPTGPNSPLPQSFDDYRIL
jgi:hypothetical protein